MEVVRSATISGTDIANGYVGFYLAPYAPVNSTVNGAALPQLVRFERTSDTVDAPGVAANSVLGQATFDVGYTGGIAWTGGGLVISTTERIATQPDPCYNVDFVKITESDYANPGELVLNHGITQPHRVIAQGFEVLNESAPLYQAGNVCVFQHPSDWHTEDISRVPAGITPAAEVYKPSTVTSYVGCNGPPLNNSQAMSQLTSKQWPAKHGCYVVGKMANMDCDVVGQQQPFIVSAGNFNVDYTYNDGNTFPINYVTGGNLLSVTTQGTGVGSVTDTTAGIGGFSSVTPGFYTYNFNGCGAIFTGLDTTNTSLTVTVKWVVEVFPSVYYNANFIPLASMSSMYDPAALAIYAKIAQLLPPGLPSGSSFIAQVPAIMRQLKKKKNPGAYKQLNG
jgi:hypothetical protein